MKLIMSYVAYLAIVQLFAIQCSSSKKEQKEEIRTKFVIDNKPNYPEGTYYQDRDGNYWHRDNIYAPKANESLKDPKFQKSHHSDYYEEAYEEGYKKGFEEGQHE